MWKLPWQKKVEIPPTIGVAEPPEALKEPPKPAPRGPLFYAGRVVEIDGFKFRITEAKGNGRLFLKLVK